MSSRMLTSHLPWWNLRKPRSEGDSLTDDPQSHPIIIRMYVRHILCTVDATVALYSVICHICIYYMYSLYIWICDFSDFPVVRTCKQNLVVPTLHRWKRKTLVKVKRLKWKNRKKKQRTCWKLWSCLQMSDCHHILNNPFVKIAT